MGGFVPVYVRMEFSGTTGAMSTKVALALLESLETGQAIEL